MTNSNDNLNTFLQCLDDLRSDIKSQLDSGVQDVRVNTFTEGLITTLCIKETFETQIRKITELYSSKSSISKGDIRKLVKELDESPDFTASAFISVAIPKFSYMANKDTRVFKMLTGILNKEEPNPKGEYTYIFASIPTLTVRNSFYFSQWHIFLSPEQCFIFQKPPTTLFSFHSIVRVLTRSSVPTDELLFQLSVWDVFLLEVLHRAKDLISKEIVAVAGDSLFLGNIANDSSYFESGKITSYNRFTDKRQTGYVESWRLVDYNNSNDGIVLTTAIGTNELTNDHLKIALRNRLKKLATKFGTVPYSDLVDEYVAIHTEFTKRGVLRNL